MAQTSLTIAACQFPIDADIDRNLSYVQRLTRQAKKQGAQVIHLPEGAVSGYAGSDFLTWDTYPWQRLAEAHDELRQLARDTGLWLIIGSSHRLSEPHLPHDSLYAISPEGTIVERYDKRFCTRGDLVCYTPGNHFSTFEINGITCGLAICFDVRFPELFRAYQQRGVRLLFHSFYNVSTEANIHTRIMRQTVQANAASNYMWISAANSSRYYQSWPSIIVKPDGTISAAMQQHRTGIVLEQINLEGDFHDASGDYRQRAIDGILYSGELVSDPRSDDRASF